MPKNHDIIEIYGTVTHQTDNAYLFSDGSKEKDGVTAKKIWLPKSQCEWEADIEEINHGCMQLPEWLALEKGLI